MGTVHHSFPASLSDSRLYDMVFFKFTHEDDNTDSINAKNVKKT